MVVVDAHQHFWDPQRVDYPWLAPYFPELARTIDFADLAPALAANGVDATVLVQAADDEGDDELMFEAAAAHREIAGVVAWVPLDDAARAEAMLERFVATGRLAGVRTLIHDQPDPDWIVRPAVADGLALLERRGLPFDLVAVLPRHLEHVPTLCERYPDLRIVVDHLAKPPIGRELGPWAERLRVAASSPNVYAKVSGLYPAAGDRLPWSVDDLRPAFEEAVETFGPSRLMFGSDWPICEVAGGYGAVAGALFALIDELEPVERAAVRGGTALECYGIGPTRD